MDCHHWRRSWWGCPKRPGGHPRQEQHRERARSSRSGTSHRSGTLSRTSGGRTEGGEKRHTNRTRGGGVGIGGGRYGDQKKPRCTHAHRSASAGHRASLTEAIHQPSRNSTTNTCRYTATRKNTSNRTKTHLQHCATNSVAPPPPPSSPPAAPDATPLPPMPAPPRPAPQRVPGPTPPNGSRKRACSAGACARRGTGHTRGRRGGMGRPGRSPSPASTAAVRARTRSPGGWGRSGQGGRETPLPPAAARAARGRGGTRCARWPRARDRGC